LKFNLKKFLKTLKLNEESISMVLGALVIVIVGILIVNYFKDKRGETTPVALTTTADKVEVGKTHTVVKGETLWGIAEEAYGSGYNWVDLYKANNLTNSKVEVGQKIEIPEVSAKQPTSTKKVATVTTVSQTITGDKYTVVKGDSLWNISVRAYGDGYKWVEVAKANKLVNPNVIHVGNVLTLPR
jgi:nucleoid-associated protein YgaU